MRTRPNRESAERIFRLTTRQAGRLFKLYARLAKLSPRYSVHALRHFCGLKLYAETRDIAYVQRVLRHRDIRSTMIYVHLVEFYEKKIPFDAPMDWAEAE